LSPETVLAAKTGHFGRLLQIGATRDLGIKGKIC